jgi:hypothetical protein
VESLMPSNVSDLIVKLNGSDNGTEAFPLFEKLWKLAQKGNAESINAIIVYINTGAIGHLRTHMLASIAMDPQVASGHDLTTFFQTGLLDDDLRYWSLHGLASVARENSYPALTAVALNESYPVAERGNAILLLARLSQQPFNRNLDRDPGNWKETDLRVEEVKSWQSAGFARGNGCARPPRDPALDNPKTAFEKVVADFDRKLELARAADSDELINPSNHLTSGSPEKIQEIRKRWNLPANQLEWLAKFSPAYIKCQIRAKGKPVNLTLYGADNFIDRQIGYSQSPQTGEPLPEWPINFVVIGDAWADPFVLDLSKSNGTDAPIYTAKHGTGEWKFRKHSSSFEDLLKGLKVKVVIPHV